MVKRFILLWGMLICSLGSLAAGSLEKALNQRWQAAWVIVQPEVRSNCDSIYTNNDIIDGRSISKASHGFPPGELAQVVKVDVKRKRIDVLLDLHEHLLVSWQDGPFVLYEDRSCKVELQIVVARDLIKRKDQQAIDALLADTLIAFSDEAGARKHPSYNRRVRESLPDDYDRTLREWEAWQREQFNRLVEERLHDSSREANRIARSVHDRPEYALGFASGMQTMRSLRLGDCQNTLESRFRSYRKRADKQVSDDWKAGYEDGQRLAYLLAVNERLQDCFQ